MKNRFLTEQETPNVFSTKTWSSIKNDTLRAYAAAGCFGTGGYRTANSPMDNQTEGVYFAEEPIGPSKPTYDTYKFFYSPTKNEVRGIKFTANTDSEFKQITASNKVKEVIYNCPYVKNLIDPPLISGSLAEKILTFMTTKLGLKNGSEFQNPSNYRSVKFLDMQKDDEFMNVYGNRITRLGDLVKSVQELPFAQNTYFWMPVKKLADVQDPVEKQNKIIESYTNSGFFKCSKEDITQYGYFYVDLNTDYSSVFDKGNYMCRDYNTKFNESTGEFQGEYDIKTCKSMINQYYGWLNPKNPDMTIGKIQIDKLKPVIKNCISKFKTDRKMGNYRKKMNYIDDIKPGNKYSLRPSVPLESEYKLGKLISESLQRLKMKKYNRY